jgi:sulfhydrogenase subunit delta
MADKIRKPRLGIYSLTGCAGDQLQILNMEDELLELVARFIIVDFQEGSSYKEPGSIDIALVEGTVSTERDLMHLKEIREKTKILIAFGNCAVEGCIQAMRNGSTSLAEKLKDVYGVEPNYFDALESKPLNEYVKVDLNIPGCPVEKDETLRAIISLLSGNTPQAFTYPVCVECKLNEYPCLITEKNLPCLGPLVRAGCNARCPGLGLDCIGCRGPVEVKENFSAEYKMLLDRGFSKEFILNRLRTFSGDLPDDFLGGAE